MIAGWDGIADPIVGFRSSTQPTKTVCRGYFVTKIATQRRYLDRISILNLVDRPIILNVDLAD
jgi:hypothetical protein